MGLAHQNPYLLLLGVLEFSAIDLAANRRGTLSEHQRAQLARKRRHALELWILTICLLVALGVILHFRLVVIGFVSATLVTMALGVWLKFDADFKEPVQSIQGAMQFSPKLTPPFGAYMLRIGNKQFTVSSRLKQALQAGGVYRIYHTAGSHTILSAELAA